MKKEIYLIGQNVMYQIGLRCKEILVVEKQIYSVKINNGMYWKDVIERRYIIAAINNNEAEEKAKILWDKEFKGRSEYPEEINSNLVNKTDNGFNIKLS